MYNFSEAGRTEAGGMGAGRTEAGSTEKDKRNEAGPQIWFAPMEGITGYTFRNVYDSCFPGVDRYYTPFIAANHTHSYKSKEGKDIAPENNAVAVLVPQVLTNKAEDFLWAAESLAAKGYREINLNLGCPSPTVVSKKKGAGFLGEPDALDRFFEEVFDGLAGRTAGLGAQIKEAEMVEDVLSTLRISVKTRIGVRDTEEATRLMEIYNRYPICSLIIHPRLQTELYRGRPHTDVFLDMCSESVHPVCYNGDICSAEDLRHLLQMMAEGRRDTQGFGMQGTQHPGLEAVMIGRGFLRRPGLIRELRGGRPADTEELRQFHDCLLEAYTRDLSPKDALFRMKELWAYMKDSFPDADRSVKKILKTKDPNAYRAAAQELFDGHSAIWAI